MASFRHSVMLGQPPGDVFPWLFEQDRVPRWTSGLEAYEVRGALGPGARVRQVLEISGQKIDVDMEVTRYEPPSGAETRFRVSGLDVVTSYALRAVDAGSELTQTLEGKAASVKARLLVPVVQPRLERKLTADLERLREVLAAA